jgi:hypothetical protein
MRCLHSLSSLRLASVYLLLISPWCANEAQVSSMLAPGTRVVMDAHNCYPYDGVWADRIERALNTGVPLAIEQDLLWYTDKRTGRSWSVVSHGRPAHGNEPTMREYFFERIRPLMEKALHDGDNGAWPLITLNLDFKSDEPAHHAAVWQLLKEYEQWICSAERVDGINKMTPLTIKPLLVLTGSADTQERDFHDIVPVGERLLVFGAVHVRGKKSMAAPEILISDSANNYRRWWNNSWDVVERGGQRKARVWTEHDDMRLRQLVNLAHARGLWIRFYTLDGAPDHDLRKNGWDKDYNFGSRERAVLRWMAAMDAGVDYLATDQYEDVAELIRARSTRRFLSTDGTAN